MSAGNGRISIDRDDTPEAGVSMLPIIRDAVAEGNFAQAILMCANVTERCVTHSHLAATRADVAIHETRQTRATIEATQMQLGQHRADFKADVDQLRADVMREFGNQGDENKALRAAIGEAPKSIDPRESRAGDHSQEELARMDSGTGLYGVVGRQRTETLRFMQEMKDDLAKQAKTDSEATQAMVRNGIKVVGGLATAVPVVMNTLASFGVTPQSIVKLITSLGQ